MLNVALTGTLASGKSSVARLFADWGAAVFDADAEVRRLQRPGTPVFQAIVERFGPEILTPDVQLDRAALRTRILADPGEREALERIVHPAVQAERRRFYQYVAPPVEILVSDIPLLFEASDPSKFDAVVTVDAPEPLRLERLMRDRGMSLEEARALSRLQLPADLKRARSDFVIDNDQSREALRDRAWVVWRKLVSLARDRA